MALNRKNMGGRRPAVRERITACSRQLSIPCTTLVADKAAREGRPISMREIRATTGLHYDLIRALQRGENVRLSLAQLTILMDYFECATVDQLVVQQHIS